jgi:S1-C subfamily serine protease
MNGNNRSDFWRSWPDEDGRRDDAENGRSGGVPDNRESEGEPAYFRYGPFASGSGEPNGNEGHAGESGMDNRGSGESVVSSGSSHGEYRETGDPGVEIKAPVPLKPMPDFGAHDASAKDGSRRKRRGERRSFAGMFAAFMAGAVMVAGLMFAADKTNLFTADAAGGSAAAVQEGSLASQPGGGSGNAGLANNVLDVVRPNSIAEIVANSQAAVVKIETYSKRTSNRSANPFYNDPFFRFFFGDEYGQPNQGQSGRLYKTGEGSGFIFDSEGYILTNQHVVDNADEIRVYVEGYENYFVAEKLGESYDLDLAALKIEGNAPFAYLPLGDADAMKVGDWVIAIGNPYGFDHTVTVGVLSAKERPITIQDGVNTRKYENLLQTDASINPGNSGGPLLNLSGEVIGINTAVSSQAQGIGFAIPTSTISGVLDNLKNDTPIPKQPQPYIGVYLADLDDTWKEELGYKGDGVLVTQVEVDGPAYRAGIRAGDIITEAAGKKTSSTQDVIEAVQAQEVGKKINLKVVRQGKTYEVVVTVGDRNNAS